MKQICKLIGGSRLYKLDTPESDTDYRGVFLNSDPKYIIGLDRHESETEKKNDVIYYEFRRFLFLLRKTNTQLIEILYAPRESFVETTEEWDEVRYFKSFLVDSERFYKSLKGYIQGEIRLMTGERTGQLGGKRKTALEEYGYSYKNYVQLRRLIYLGKTYYETGEFEIQLSGDFREELLTVKLNPSVLTVDEATRIVLEKEKELDKAFGNTKIYSSFNEEVATQLIWNLYRPILTNHKYGGEKE